MRSEAEIIAGYQGRALLPAAVLAFQKDAVKAKAVVSPKQIANAVERHFQVRPSDMAAAAVLEYGAEYHIWRVIGRDVGNLHAEVLPQGISQYVNAWRYIEDSDLYALETVGHSHLLAALAAAKKKGKSDFEFNQKVGHDAKGDLNFDKLRDGVNFMHGLHQYQLRGHRRLPHETNDIDWAKWGAIAAWVIIPLTIVGIVVAVWLDNN